MSEHEQLVDLQTKVEKAVRELEDLRKHLDAQQRQKLDDVIRTLKRAL